MAAINPNVIAAEIPELTVLNIPVNMPINPVSCASISPLLQGISKATYKNAPAPATKRLIDLILLELLKYS
jgi:hypothetical protein